MIAPYEAVHFLHGHCRRVIALAQGSNQASTFLSCVVGSANRVPPQCMPVPEEVFCDVAQKETTSSSRPITLSRSLCQDRGDEKLGALIPNGRRASKQRLSDMRATESSM